MPYYSSMPQFSQSADQGQTKERASAIRQASGRLKLTELISKISENKQKEKGSPF